jgi:hypothetical protein
VQAFSDTEHLDETDDCSVAHYFAIALAPATRGSTPRWRTLRRWVAGRLIPTVLSLTVDRPRRSTTVAINGSPSDADAFDVMASRTAGRSLRDAVALDVYNGVCYRVHGVELRCEGHYGLRMP